VLDSVLTAAPVLSLMGEKKRHAQCRQHAGVSLRRMILDTGLNTTQSARDRGEDT
jgi:hypothetical protein